MSEYIKNLKVPIAIIGMGKSGAAAKKLLLASGIATSDVYTFDGKQSDVQYSDPGLMMTEVAPKTLVVSPGVPLALPWIKEARNRGAHITSEINLACSTLGEERLIGVTGSVGKSTTVSILQAGVKSFSNTAFIGGNLGTPFSTYAAEVISGQRSRADWVVLELSSYQLENSALLKLDLSAITYFTANHLERYSNLEEYYKTKWLIADITRHEVVLNHNGGDLQNFCKSKSSAKILWATPQDSALKVFKLETAKLLGKHNQDNLAVAALLAMRAGWPDDSIHAMKNFTGLQHRLENLGEIKGIRFINDSKATALDSVLIAATATIETRVPESTVYFLLGGKDKGLPWETMTVLGSNTNAEFVFFGECRESAQLKSKLPGNSYPHLKEAFQDCISRAASGDTILLSPGGTSLDEFKNFEDRGDFFKLQIALFAKS